MNLLKIFMMLMSVTTSPTSEAYIDLAAIATTSCKNAKEQNIDPNVINGLIRIEMSFNPPHELQGMLLAAACSESGFKATQRGDKHLSKSGKHPMAHGMLQLWPWWERAYDIDRDDWEESARAWMTHISSMIPKVKKQCHIKNRDSKRLWSKAWVRGIRSRKPGGRCNETAKHEYLLRRWHKRCKRCGDGI